VEIALQKKYEYKEAIQLIDVKYFIFPFCQENEQYNHSKGILRGLHYQVKPYEQAKYCHVAKGKVLSVAVDLRKNSKDFGKYISYELDDIKKQYMFIPKGCAHGYITLSDESIFIYQVDEYFNLDAMRSILFSDENLKIDWKVEEDQIIVSQKDAVASKFKDIKIYGENLC